MNDLNSILAMTAVLMLAAMTTGDGGLQHRMSRHGFARWMMALAASCFISVMLIDPFWLLGFLTASGVFYMFAEPADNPDETEDLP